ncbi:MAG: carboxymuconolactone decarboxylase family protein [Sulfuricurvum sp.]
MPLIQTIDPSEATGELANLYAMIEKMGRTVGNNAKLFSISPEILRQQLDFIKHYMNHPTLSMPLLAAIRIMVSGAEECQFCVDYNTAMLINLAGWREDQVSAMRKDPASANLPKREKAMLLLVIKAIRNAHGVSANDLDVLREMGWEDRDIFDAVNHAARMLSTDILFNAFRIEDYRG